MSSRKNLSALNDKELKEIKLLLSKDVSQSAIAKKFNTSQSTISKIKNDKVYHSRTSKDIVVYGVPDKTKTELHNIVDNLGVPFSTFMKMEYRKICDSYPDKMKIPRSKD